ncbi:hypothetical protein HDIA_0097 [Hartmannibacter diazotrophicus]|uniref:Integral membrane protein n=1 Tax=Hartmannibacter diazotrophicus TaxID=1482074 RepID=A0A2C9D0E6_9HYPH|nr:hypothetical protein [Hartmannibacter diazotrophicus]SON53638.1 hypothetical protein HDIA_0097 [Hartmannibacter diazotrophicus]
MFFSSQTFVLVHVVISLVAVVAGFVMLAGFLRNERREFWSQLFLVMTIATSVTGFLFPISVFTPALAFGVLSMVVLAICVYARYGLGLAGRGRTIYLVTALFALYLNVFVLIAQAFQKVSALNALAPTGSEPPFAIAQGLLLVAFLVFGFLSLRRFKGIAAAA